MKIRYNEQRCTYPTSPHFALGRRLVQWIVIVYLIIQTIVIAIANHKTSPCKFLATHIDITSLSPSKTSTLALIKSTDLQIQIQW